MNLKSISPRRTSLLAVACLVPIVSGAPLGVTQQQTATTPVASTAHVPEEMLHGFQYRMTGPHRGGRATAVAGVAGDHRTFYMGATGGGVWKTTDAGDVWENVSDRFFSVGSVGAIAVAPSDPKIVYVGTGSANIRSNIELGHGSYKSTDAGATWSSIGLEEAGQIAKIRIDPRDTNRVYVAAVGHAFGPNPLRGVLRSRDGGKTWDKVLFVNDHTGAVDLVMASDKPDVLYAVMWTGERQPWGMVAGSAEGGVFKTTDGGDHWTKLTGGLPTGIVGKIGVAVSPAMPNRVWGWWTRPTEASSGLTMRGRPLPGSTPRATSSGGRGTTAISSPTPKIPTCSTRPTPTSSVRPTAARPSSRSPCRTATTTSFGSTRMTTTS